MSSRLRVNGEMPLRLKGLVISDPIRFNCPISVGADNKLDYVPLSYNQNIFLDFDFEYDTLYIKSGNLVYSSSDVTKFNSLRIGATIDLYYDYKPTITYHNNIILLTSDDNSNTIMYTAVTMPSNSTDGENYVLLKLLVQFGGEKLLERLWTNNFSYNGSFGYSSYKCVPSITFCKDFDDTYKLHYSINYEDECVTIPWNKSLFTTYSVKKEDLTSNSTWLQYYISTSCLRSNESFT